MPRPRRPSQPAGRVFLASVAALAALGLAGVRLAAADVARHARAAAAGGADARALGRHAGALAALDARDLGQLDDEALHLVDVLAAIVRDGVLVAVALEVAALDERVEAHVEVLAQGLEAAP